MIKISKMADYSTVIMAYLAQLGQQATAREIADATHIMLPTVAKLLKSLVNHDLLQSVRGAHGGYGLAKPAASITLADILHATEDDISMTECATLQSSCSRQAFCHVSDHWRAISQVIQTALEGLTLADMLAGSDEIAVRAEEIGLMSKHTIGVAI